MDATLFFAVRPGAPSEPDDRVFPYSWLGEPDSIEKTQFTIRARRLHLHDLRHAQPDDPSGDLDSSGFAVLWNAPSNFAHEDFDGALGSRELPVPMRYRDECATIMRDRLGASRVFAWNHFVRRTVAALDGSADPLDPEVPASAPRAHVDQSASHGRMLIRDVAGIGADGELESWVARGGRAAVVNFWRPLKPVHSSPLAVCDARTVQEPDLLAASDAYGQGYSVAYSDGQRWAYVSSQQPQEVLLLLCYDTDTDPELHPGKRPSGRGRCCPHSAVWDDPSQIETRKEQRESVEVRTVIVWDPPA